MTKYPVKLAITAFFDTCRTSLSKKEPTPGLAVFKAKVETF